MLDAVVQDDSNSSTKLSDDEIVSHGVPFIVAGHETTATALSYVTYHLAIYPTIQEKVQLEIDDYFENNPVRVTSVKLVVYYQCKSCWLVFVRFNQLDLCFTLFFIILRWI